MQSPDTFQNGHQLKKWLRSKGIVGRMQVIKIPVKDVIQKAIWRNRQWYWFVGVEPLQFERAEALLDDPGYYVCREATEQEREKERERFCKVPKGQRCRSAEKCPNFADCYPTFT